MKKALKITLISLLSIVLLTIAAMLIVANVIFTPKKITPIVNSVLADMVDDNTKVKSVSINFFTSFPNLNVTLDSLTVADSLGSNLIVLKELKLKVDIVKYLKSKDVVIHGVEFDGLGISILTDKNGVSNIPDFKFLSDSTATDTTDTTEFKIQDYIKSIDIKKISLNQGRIYSNDELLGTNASIQDISMNLAGAFMSNQSDFDLELKCDGIDYRINNNYLLKNLNIGINTQLEFNKDSLLLTIADAGLNVGQISLKTNGSLRGDKKNMALITDLDFNLATPSLGTIIDAIPERLVEKGHQFSAGGSVELGGSIKGVYNKVKREIPSINLDFLVDKGNFKFDEMAYGVDQLDIAAELLIDGKNIKKSFLDIKKILVTSDAGIGFSTNMKATNLLGNCDINFNLISGVNISRIKDVLPVVEGIILEGMGNIELKGRGSKKDLVNKNFGALYLSGKSEFEDLLLVVDGSKLVDTTAKGAYLFIQMDKGNFTFGSETKNVGESKEEQNLSANIAFTGLGFKNKKGLEVVLSNVDFKANSKLGKDTTQITPISGELVLDMLTANVQDTLSSYITSSKISFKIEPSKEDKTKAIAVLAIRADTMDVKAIPSNTNVRLNAAGLYLNITPDASKTTGYSMEGVTGFAGLKIINSLFPLDISMKESQLSFIDNRIELSQSKVQMGRSNITATGWIDNLWGKMFLANNNKIVCDLSLASDNIDLTELYNTSIEAYNLPSADTDIIEQAPDVISTDEIDSPKIVMIPNSIDAKLNVNLLKLTLGDHIVKNVNGRIEVSERTMKLNNLELYTADSQMNISALYNSVSDTLAHCILNLKVDKIVLKDMIGLIPSIDSLIPALGSIEGIVDFEMVAKTDIDNTMSFVLPSLESVINLTGENLVLLDGETFQKISKMLLFKNKERNLIDSLGVYVVVRKGGEIIVPPFEITMDRYRAIIGGTQTLDFNNFDIDYKYNVSIVKSPLPFKAGVDIKGKNDDFDFKITKAKLKRSDFSLIQVNLDSLQNELRHGL